MDFVGGIFLLYLDPYYYFLGRAVDFFHMLYLGVPLQDICLVDASRVDPEYTRFNVMAEMVKYCPKLFGNLKVLVVALDCTRAAGSSPSI